MKVLAANLIAVVGGTTYRARLRLKDIEIMPMSDTLKIESLRNFRTRTGTDIRQIDGFTVNVTAELSPDVFELYMRLICPTQVLNVYVPKDVNTVAEKLSYEIQTEVGTYLIPEGYISDMKINANVKQIPTISVSSQHFGTITTATLTNLTAQNFMNPFKMALRYIKPDDTVTSLPSSSFDVTISSSLECIQNVGNTFVCYSQDLTIDGKASAIHAGTYNSTLEEYFYNNTDFGLEFYYNDGTYIRKITFPRVRINNFDKYVDIKMIEFGFVSSYVSTKYILQYANS